MGRREYRLMIVGLIGVLALNGWLILIALDIKQQQAMALTVLAIEQKQELRLLAARQSLIEEDLRVCTLRNDWWRRWKDRGHFVVISDEAMDELRKELGDGMD